MAVVIEVPAVPVAQPRQRHRVMQLGGKAVAKNYTPGNHPVVDFKATVRMAAQQRFKGAPMTGPLVLCLDFAMPRPKSRIWKTRPMESEPHIGRPDLDNLIKATCDALNGLLWVDDSQICTMRVSKNIAAGDEQPGVTIEVMDMDEWKRESEF